MKALLLSFLFVFVQLSVLAQFNVCPHGTYNMGVIYSCAVDDQVYWASRRDVTGTIVTADGGNTWTVSNFTDPKAFQVYCIHAFNADVAFVTASTIYKTTNRGTTWTPATGVFSNAASFPNTIHFFDQNNGVAMGDPVDGYFEIYTTTNAGVNWVRVSSSNIPTPLTGETGVVDWHAYYNDSYWFSTSSQRIFRSTDRGYTWTCSQFPTGNYIPSIAFRDELHGLSDAIIGSTFYIYKTSDGGNTWSYNALPNWIYGYPNIEYIPGTQSIYTITSFSYCGNEIKNIVLFTKDDGLTWHRMDDWGPWLNGDGTGNHQWSSVNSGWGSLWRGNAGSIYHWSGYTGKHIWRAASSLKYGSIVFGEVGDTIEISIGNYGTMPTTVNGLNLSSANFSLINPPSLPIVLPPWNVFEVSISFTPQMRGVFKDSLVILSDAANYNSLSTHLNGKSLQFTPPLHNLIYAASDSLFTITLSDLEAIPIGDFDGKIIEGLATMPVDSVFVGIAAPSLCKIDPVVGGCITFLNIPIGGFSAFAYSSSGTLFAGKKTGQLYRINTTTGEGTLIGSTGKALSSFAFSPIDGKLYAAISPAIGSSKDAIYTIDTTTADVTLIGLTGDGKGTPSISFDADGTLYGLKGTGNDINKLITINTTNGSGTEIGELGVTGLRAIYASQLVTGIKDDNDNQLISYQLFQNFPNPFNPSTVISYQIPVMSKLTLKIYDVLGNEIATLVTGEKPAGSYEVEFNASALPSGVYFYQLKAEEFVSTKKMILLK